MAKLNFWQWLGVVLLIVGVVLILTRKTDEQTVPLPGTPATQPAPLPATNPG